MPSDGSVTHWLQQLREGDAAAAQPLWERYFRRLVGLARARLRDTPRRAADEEDVALSAFDSFCQGVEAGRFPRLDDRDNLWRVLVALTARKAIDLTRTERRRKRGSGGVLDEAALGDGPAGAVAALEDFVGREPTPEFAAELAEECRRLLDLLPDAGLRDVAVWKMEGFTNAEIAERLGCGLRSVERKLRLIRAAWEKEGAA
jgi:DNA-directed RNA polymerase specialized sigma24 family protein